jgi:hypothetical protein
MTLVAAWVRQNSTLKELIVAADSRISGGGAWDACPKIVALPRPATVMAMSGWAVEAYAFMLQAINTCTLQDGHGAGRTDIGNLANKLRDAYADIRTHISDLPDGQKAADIPMLNVALFGWSWRNLRFEGYSYSFDAAGELIMKPLGELNVDTPYPCYLFGDAAPDARRRLKSLMKQRDRPFPRAGDPEAPRVAREAFMDWEPLETLCEVISDPEVRSVGGVPQIARISQYGESEFFVWRDNTGRDYFGGRPVQAMERFDRRIAQLRGQRVTFSFSDRSILFGQAETE